MGIKGPVHFLEKEGRMNSDIYINQVLEGLGLPFYYQCNQEKGTMIWMDDDVAYHTSKKTAAYCHLLVYFAWIGLLSHRTSTPSKTYGRSLKYGSVPSLTESIC